MAFLGKMGAHFYRFQCPETILPGITKMLCCCESSTDAVLFFNQDGKTTAASMKFANEADALAWCRKNQTVLLFVPFNVWKK